jgi:ABC-2 type transport system ATP-binding protein
MATAYLDEAERCHRVGLLHHGRLLALDTPERIKRRMPGHVVEIVAADPARARRAVAGAPGVTAVTVFGQRLHVAVDDLARDLPAATAALAAAGVAAGAPREIVPSLEDVFIAMIRGSARATGGRAA